MALEELFVRGKIALGVFESERTFEVEIGRTLYSGILDKKDVICEEEPQPNKSVYGKIRVYVIKKEKEKVLVGFARDAINGQRAWVPEKSVSYSQ